jgi:hypothetical protein
MRIVLLVLALGLVACSSGRPDRQARPMGGRPNTPTATGPTVPAATPTIGEPASPAPEAHRVTFALRGSIRHVSVTYTAQDGRRQHTVVNPPWSRTFTVNDGGEVDVTAHGSGDGELTCTLKVDGDLVKSATSSGDSATVDCGDSLGF